VDNRDSNPGFLRRHLPDRIDRFQWRGMRSANGLNTQALRTGAAGFRQNR
jgi:hypothetical protein